MERSSNLSELTWPEVGRSAENKPVLAIPLGATEQHGPHLPLSCDTAIAIALCERLSLERRDIVVAPALPYGSSGEHADFPGTISIGQQGLELVLLEIGRSTKATFPHLLFVCAHGGNIEPGKRATEQLKEESRSVYFFCSSEAVDLHAGHFETSILLSLAPNQVQMNEAVVGDRRPFNQIWPILRTKGVRQVSDNGVLGNPLDASAPAGEVFFDQLYEHLAREVTAWRSQHDR